ncbi:unnamed protein product [Parajaminaea phylloscopi]
MVDVTRRRTRKRRGAAPAPAATTATATQGSSAAAAVDDEQQQQQQLPTRRRTEAAQARAHAQGPRGASGKGSSAADHVHTRPPRAFDWTPVEPAAGPKGRTAAATAPAAAFRGRDTQDRRPGGDATDPTDPHRIGVTQDSRYPTPPSSPCHNAPMSGDPTDEAAAAGEPVPSASKPSVPVGKDSRKLPVQYTGFYPPPPLNTKYVSSSFLRTETQTLAGRIAAGIGGRGYLGSGKRKRRADDGEALAASDGEEGDEEDDDGQEEELQRPGVAAAARTIIVHPGSTYIRVGLATDVSPVVWPSVIARRNRIGTPALRSGPSPSEDEAMADDLAAAGGSRQESEPRGKTSPDEGKGANGQDSRINLMRADLRQILRNMKLRGVANGKGLAASYNASAKPESIPSHNDFGDEWTPEDPKQAKEIELGERALKLASLSPAPGSEGASTTAQNGRPWKLFRPFKAGKLNYAPYFNTFGTVGERALSSDLAVLLRSIISSAREDLTAPGKIVEGAGHTLYGLGIPQRDFASHSVIVVIPDLFPKDDARLITEILMTELGFAQVILQQESTAATFGAGMSSALVVHVGGERASVSCVDEGLLLQDTRMHLDYGGHDVTLFLYDLLKRANFAYRECDPAKRVADELILEDLKKQMITLDPGQIGLFIYNFFLRLPSNPTKKYEVRVYDEAILAGMLLFGLGVQAVDFASKQKTRDIEARTFSRHQFSQGGDDAEDIDDAAIRDSEKRMLTTAAMTSSVKHLIPQPGEASATDGPEEPVVEDAGTAPAANAPSRDVSAAPSMAPNASSDQNKVKPPAKSHFDVLGAASQVPLELAILHSLLLSSSPVAQGPFPQAPTAGQMTTAIAAGEDRLRRLAGNILVIGGSARIQGIGTTIEGRLTPHLDNHYTARAQEKAAAAQAAQAEATKAQAEADEVAAAAASAAAAAAAAANAASADGAAGDTSSPAPITSLVPGSAITTANANAAAAAATKTAAAAVAAAQTAAMTTAPTVSVIPPPRDLDPTLLAWKGMAVLPRLDSAAEMWVTQDEWKLLGWKCVKDKCAFL